MWVGGHTVPQTEELHHLLVWPSCHHHVCPSSAGAEVRGQEANAPSQKAATNAAPRDHACCVCGECGRVSGWEAPCAHAQDTREKEERA